MKFNSSSVEKRILFGTTVGLSAQALLRGQLGWFREQGWSVTLVTSPDVEASRATERERVSFYGIPMKRTISLTDDIKSALRWVRLIRQLRPHVVNVGTPKAGLLGTFAAWLCRVPRRIYTVRGLRLEGTKGFLSKLLWVMERATIAMATDVIAISPSLGKELARRKLVAPDEIWTIGKGSSNGVDVKAIQEQITPVDKDTQRQELGIGPKELVVGYIGRVTPAKGVDTLLRAMQSEQLDDGVHLLIIGSVEDEHLGDLIHKDNDRIHLVSWTDNVWEYLSSIDVLCLPTLREGFGNVVLEAAAAGVPAITTRTTGAIDTVIDGETGYLIDVGDAAALVECINLLVNNLNLRDSLGVNARLRAQRDFNPEVIWRGIEAISNGKPDIPQVKRLSKNIEQSR